ncbi:MAG: Anhydro-N-acetylmuramic acid kinase [Verrucomicrobiales bacterium]|nr:Anhydro-N-acetylmuramic acid kinase [Verrucomicrobiales bacterium]
MAVLGIMSGTSIDAVDYASCLVTHRGIELQELWTARYPKRLQTRLHEAARGAITGHELCQLHHDTGRFFARHALRGKQKPRLAGLHGQTVFHQPKLPNPATFQLGEPAYLVEALRVPVVSNFRAADLAAGGQGAPLATAFHQMAFGLKGRHVCVQNLGGIANVTSIDWKRGSKPDLMSFDTGPANMLMDMAARHYTGGKWTMDRNGGKASRGECAEDLLQDWLHDPFFRKAPPKSTGREYFGELFFKKAIKEAARKRLSAEDLLATCTEFTARSIALNYQLHLAGEPDQVILAGGGARNSFLVGRIRVALNATCPRAELSLSDALGWPGSALEPAAFAWLAFLRIHKQPGNLPETTGARRAAVLGQLSEY